MKITIDNYEAYMLDFVEGTLSASDRKEMELFLQQHPDIAILLNEFNASPSLVALESELSNSFKSLLKKEEGIVTPVELTHLLIKEVEGDLSEVEQSQLIFQLKNNSAALQEQKIVALTKLQPDLSIVFADKETLKRKSKVVPLFYYTSVAASLLIAFGSYYLFSNSETSAGAKIDRVSFAFNTLNTVEKTTTKNVIEKNATYTVSKSKKLSTETEINRLAHSTTVEKVKYNPVQILPIQTINSLPLQNDVLLAAYEEIVPEQKNTNPVTAPSLPSDQNFLTLQQFVAKKVKQSSNNKKELPTAVEKQKINGFDIAGLAVNALAGLTGKKMELEKTYAKDGSVKAYALVTENFEFSRKK